MSQEITLFRDEKGIVPAGGGGLDEVTKRLLGNASYKRISIRGKKFRMIVNGQEAARAPGSALEVVVVNAAPAVSRHWYAKTYDPGSVGMPDCWSNDGARPDPRALTPQGKTCESCPKNIQGSGTNGSRACKFARRLAVVLANDVQHSDVYQVQLPATSLFGKVQNGNMPLDAYVKHLAGHNYSIAQVVTEMVFDDDVDSPKLFFRGIRRLDAQELAAVAVKAASPEAEAAVTFNPAQMDMLKKDRTPTPAPPPPAEPPLFREEPKQEAAPAEEPVVRTSKAKPAEPVEPVNVDAMLDDWADDD